MADILSGSLLICSKLVCISVGFFFFHGLGNRLGPGSCQLYLLGLGEIWKGENVFADNAGKINPSLVRPKYVSKY